MIITIQGTKYRMDGAAKLAGALSFLGIVKDQRPSLILQFTNKTRESVENLLIGASLRNESFVQDTSIPDISAGMDALFVHSGTQLTKELFNETTRKLTSTGVKNFYDIAFCTNKESFEKEFLEKNKKSKAEEKDFIEAFIKAAAAAYKDVYIVVNSRNVKLSSQVTKYADVNINIVPQARKESVITGPDRNIFVINDYCSGSMFNPKSMMKDYDTKIIYALMHNVPFNDACANGTLLSFMQSNINAIPGDINYDLMHNIELIYDSVVRNAKRKTEDVDPDRTIYSYEGQKFIDMPWTEINGRVVTKVVKQDRKHEVLRTNIELTDDPYIPEEQNSEEDQDIAPIEDIDIPDLETPDDVDQPETKDIQITFPDIKEEKKMKKGGLFSRFSRKPKKDVDNVDNISIDQTEAEQEEPDVPAEAQDNAVDDADPSILEGFDIEDISDDDQSDQDKIQTLADEVSEEIEMPELEPEGIADEPIVSPTEISIPDIDDIPDIEVDEASQQAEEATAEPEPAEIPDVSDVPEIAKDPVEAAIEEAVNVQETGNDEGEAVEDAQEQTPEIVSEPVKAEETKQAMTEEDRLNALLNGLG